MESTSKSFAALPSAPNDEGVASSGTALLRHEEQEELLVKEVKQKLNALLLYKYQHSRATR